MYQKPQLNSLLVAFFLVVGLIAMTRFTPLRPHWGSLEMRPTSTITVSGQAQKDQANQLAQFTAGVESIEETKEEALNKANEAMNELIVAVKALGIEDQDIQTEVANVYQETEYERAEILIYPPMPDRGTAVKGNWRANNSVSIKLRQVDLAEDLLAILNRSGANYVYGPNFMIDDTMIDDATLLSEAVANAKAKAESIAAGNNQKVGKIISLNESGAYPMYAAYETATMAMGSAKDSVRAELEPGSSTSYKNVTVTFELY
jgi:uncharacterized protein